MCQVEQSLEDKHIEFEVLRSLGILLLGALAKKDGFASHQHFG